MTRPISQEPRSPAAERRRRDIERLGPWFHNLHLPDGSQTAPDHPLGDFPRYKWSVLAPHLPQRLEGWTVLDIGANAGFYTFELAKRGARVTAIDVDDHYLDQARWAAPTASASCPTSRSAACSRRTSPRSRRRPAGR